MKNIIPIIIIISFGVFACNNDDFETNQEKLLGLWVSQNKVDTLEFVDQSSFYKNHDHFDYNLTNDSIGIRYRGILYIGVHSTRHKYSLIDNSMTIDFTNKQCYGFVSVIQTFEKQ